MTSFALITPSFSRDFEQCRILSESISKFVPEHVEHHVIVDRRDMKLFSSLRSSRTHVVCNMDLFPWWLRQLPFTSKWWANLKGFPVRGWIIQQLTKLSADVVSTADVFIFVDSDVFLVKPYDPRATLRDDLVPMFRELRENAEEENHMRWYTVAARVLGIPAQERYEPSYVNNLIPWRRENLIKLHRRIEEVSGRPWIETLCREGRLGNRFGEYVLYGVFCEQILKEKSGHYFDATISTQNHWADRPLDEEGLRRLREGVQPQHIGVMISAKSRTDPRAIRRVFDFR